MTDKANSLSRAKWMCKYHIVFTPKYRRKMTFYQYRGSLIEISKSLYKYKEVEIIEGHMMSNHVHMLIGIPPKLLAPNLMGYLGGRSALMVFDRHANLRYKFGNRRFWAEGYYMSTAELNGKAITKYIRKQERHNITLDKLSAKEYINPFGK